VGLVVDVVTLEAGLAGTGPPELVEGVVPPGSCGLETPGVEKVPVLGGGEPGPTAAGIAGPGLAAADCGVPAVMRVDR
jgi:hypothetical protein